MSNETKQDVFEDVLTSYMNAMDIVIDEMPTDGTADRLNLGNIIQSSRARYAAALPDDLPTLPRIIGEYLKDSKLAHNGISFLFQVGNHAMSDYRIVFENWAFTGKSFDEYEKGDTFARAWVLGVWRVEETGEVVKL